MVVLAKYGVYFLKFGARHVRHHPFRTTLWDLHSEGWYQHWPNIGLESLGFSLKDPTHIHFYHFLLKPPQRDVVIGSTDQEMT